MKARNYAIDIFKGLLVLGMVYCHVLQFFGRPDLYPIQDAWIQLFNSITFPGFVFGFGYTGYLAYYRKPYQKVYLNMLRTAFKCLIAFYISGIGFRVLREGKFLSLNIISPILMLTDMPGWSEFLASFFAISLLSVLFFEPLKRMIEHKWWILGVSSALLLLTFFPYEVITDNRLALLIGTKQFTCFPILQYFPYYIVGLLFARYQIVWNKLVAIGCVVLTALSFILEFTFGSSMVERFPPELGWMLRPLFVLYLYYLAANGMVHVKIPFAWVGKLTKGFRLTINTADKIGLPLATLITLGSNSLYYLTMTNLVIFWMAGVNKLPRLAALGMWPWNQDIHTTFGAASWTLVILVICGFLGSFVRQNEKAQRVVATVQSAAQEFPSKQRDLNISI